MNCKWIGSELVENRKYARSEPEVNWGWNVRDLRVIIAEREIVGEHTGQKSIFFSGDIIVLEFTSHKVRKEKIQILMHICVIFHLFHLLFLISGNPRVLNFCLKWKLSIHFCSVCELDP